MRLEEARQFHLVLIVKFYDLEGLFMSIYEFSFKKLGNSSVVLSEYKGKTLLIVNVASLCGFTSQYENLQKLHEKLSDKSFSILAFPCNDFSGPPDVCASASRGKLFPIGFITYLKTPCSCPQGVLVDFE